MQKYIINGIIASAVVLTGFGTYMCYRSRLKLLSKQSLISILSQIREEFSYNFYPILYASRNSRRQCRPGDSNYVELVRSLKEESKATLHSATEKVTKQKRITEEDVIESINHWNDDAEVQIAVLKLQRVEINQVSSSLTIDMLKDILSLYISTVATFDLSDTEVANIQMKLLEDEIANKFGVEPEEIEFAVQTFREGLEPLVSEVEAANKKLQGLIT